MSKMNFVGIPIDFVEHITKKAALCYIKGSDEPIWIPLSVMATEDADNIALEDNDITIRIQDWFAKKEGLA